MKRLLMLMLLMSSCNSWAAVVPTEPVVMRKPSIIRTDETKRQAVVTRQKLSDEVGSGPVADLNRYSDVLALDNIKAIENMSRLMQDDPNGFVQAMGGGDISQTGFEFDRTKMGTNEVVAPYVRSIETDDPAQKFASLHAPALMGSFEATRESKQEFKELHARVLAQMESIGHQHLGQKIVPIQKPITVDEIKQMVGDTRSLPKNWEEILRQNEEAVKKIKESEAQKAAEQKAEAEKSNPKQPQGNAQKAK